MQLPNNLNFKIPEIQVSLNSDINILKILMISALKKLSFSIELLKIQFSKGLSKMNFNNVELFVSSDIQTKCSVEIKPIEIKLPEFPVEIPLLAVTLNNLNGNLAKVQCNEISVLEQNKVFLSIQKMSFYSMKFRIPSLKIDISYLFLLRVVSFVHVVYKYRLMPPKKFKIPFKVRCNFVHFRFELSDDHKIEICFENGFKIARTKSDINENSNANIQVEGSETINSISSELKETSSKGSNQNNSINFGNSKKDDNSAKLNENKSNNSKNDDNSAKLNENESNNSKNDDNSAKLNENQTDSNQNDNNNNHDELNAKFNDNEVFDLCTVITIPSGTCWTYDREHDAQRTLIELSDCRIGVVSTKFFRLSCETFNLSVSPMFAFLPYFKIIAKSMSNLMDVIKGPDFTQPMDSPPTPIHVSFKANQFRVFILKNELTAKVDQSNDAKAFTISEVQLRLQNFLLKLKEKQVKKGSINEDEVVKTFNEMRFRLFHDTIQKIQEHNHKNGYEKFATFELKDVKIDVDGFREKTRKEMIENFTENEKYKTLKLTKEKIGKLNSLKISIEIGGFDIFTNINAQFSQYQMCKMGMIQVDVDFSILDKKANSPKDYFLYELTLDGEKFNIPLLASEPLLIYDNLNFSFDRFSFKMIPSFFDYYLNSMILITQLFQKIIEFPKINIFDNFRVKNVIYGNVKFNTLKFHLMHKPFSSSLSVTFLSLAYNFVNPLKYVISNERFLINLKNKELFLSFPMTVIEVNLTILNKNFEKENEIVTSPFIEIDPSRMHDRDYDPYEMVRSKEIEIKVDLKFPQYEKMTDSDVKDQLKANKINFEAFIIMNIEHLSKIINQFLIKKKFVFDKISCTFEKSLKKRNPVKMIISQINSPVFPATDILFNIDKINVYVNNFSFKKDKENESPQICLKSLEIWFMRMEKHTGFILFKNIVSKDPIDNNISNFRMEIFDKFLIHSFFRILSILMNFVNHSAKNKNKENHSLSLFTKKQEDKNEKNRQKKLYEQKCTQLDPETPLNDLFNIFYDVKLFVNLKKADIICYHSSYIPPSIKFKDLSLEGRKSDKYPGGMLNIIKFVEFKADIIQQGGLPFILANEMEFDVMLSIDRIFVTAILKQGMVMNIHSESISMVTDELFSNLPKIELIFNDEDFIEYISRRQKEKSKKKKSIEEDRKRRLSLTPKAESDSTTEISEADTNDTNNSENTNNSEHNSNSNSNETENSNNNSNDQNNSNENSNTQNILNDNSLNSKDDSNTQNTLNNDSSNSKDDSNNQKNLNANSKKSNEAAQNPTQEKSRSFFKMLRPWTNSTTESKQKLNSIPNPAPKNEIIPFARQFGVLIYSGITIDLLDTNFNQIATLKTNEISYKYVSKQNMTEKQDLTIGNLTVLNRLAPEKDKSGKPNRYCNFLTTDGSNDQKFLKMSITRDLRLMKLPCFSIVSIEIIPIVVNISSEFVKELTENFKVFKEFDVFNFDKMKKYFDKIEKTSKTDDKEEDKEYDSFDMASMTVAAGSSNSDSYGFYAKVEVSPIELTMSVMNDYAKLLKAIENIPLKIRKIVVTDLFATKNRVMKLVKKKMTLNIWKSTRKHFKK
ncbi:hypothetical protein M9Y10_012227 [Tritrichomonas musculus]|uniref:Chorein N-terminal domain-containing protein n=1 Tax=Tritrichomonas musculus TaxID=1915356 RepID=A0ABR2IDP5_9EUKA